MRRPLLFLFCALAATAQAQTAVDAPRTEQKDRQRKTVERQQERKTQNTDLEIRGATAFKLEDLRSALKEQITIIHDFGLTAARADDAAFFLELFYRKHGYARVHVSYLLPGGSRLILEVNEGPLAQLATIDFSGNVHFPPAKLFEYAVGPTRERYSRLQATLPYVAADVEEGADLVRRFYISEGFLEAEVSKPSARFSEDGARVNVTIPVHEGRQYFFGDLRFSGNTVYGAEALRGQLADIIAQPFTDRRVDDISRRLQAYFKARGYYAVKIATSADPTTASAAHVPVAITLSPGPVYRFDGTTIRGLQRLRPSYVRNRFRSLSGKPYSPDVLDEKFRELMRTGLFSILQINPQPIGGNLLRLDIAAEEAKAKEFGFYLGYGSYEGPIIGAQFGDRDLFGYGRPLLVSAEWSGRGYKGDILWDDPHFFESDLEFKARLSALRFDFDGYSKFEIGARFEFSYKFTRQYEVALFVQPRHVEILNDEIRPETLVGRTSYFIDSIGISQTLDLRDSPVVPTRGLIVSQSVDLATGALGSQIEFLRATGRASYFIPVGKTTIELGARGGVIRPLNENSSDIGALPIDERFFNGGSTSVRSFGERDLGPHDRRGHPIGGQFYTIFNIEYTFPIFGELQGAIFTDAGNLLPNADDPSFDEMHYAIGAGLRYKLPIGPLRLDYGVNPDPKPYEDFGAFHFSFGFAF